MGRKGTVMRPTYAFDVNVFLLLFTKESLETRNNRETARVVAGVLSAYRRVQLAVREERTVQGVAFNTLVGAAQVLTAVDVLRRKFRLSDEQLVNQFRPIVEAFAFFGAMHRWAPTEEQWKSLRAANRDDIRTFGYELEDREDGVQMESFSRMREICPDLIVVTGDLEFLARLRNAGFSAISTVEFVAREGAALRL
jgi:hypothetical protein